MVQPFWKTIGQFLTKLNTILQCDPVNQDPKNPHTMFIATLFITAKVGSKQDV